MKISLIAWHRDGGDGCITARFFNSKAELVKHLAGDEYYPTIEQIESGEDPYEFGMLDNVEFEITDDGKLAKPFYVSFG